MIKPIITLVRPPYVIPKTSVFGHRGTPALGLAYIAGSLRTLEFQVHCIDSFSSSMDQFSEIENTNLLVNGLTNEQTIERIPSESSIIGISCMFSSEWINTSKLIKGVRKRFPDALIVMGGEHVTADHEYILKNYIKEVDICILGEGEHKFTQLGITYTQNKEMIYDSPGITYLDKKTQEVITTDGNYRIKDLATIPIPSWEGLNIDEFLKRKIGMSSIGKVSMPMLLSRGCPYQCTFCSSANMWTTRWTPRDLDLVIEEINLYISKYSVTHIDFYDLTAVVNKKWTMQFCQRLIDDKINITWSLPSGTRSEALTKDVLELIKKSGCLKLTYAPETGSVRMSKLIKKRTNLKNMLSSMRHAVKLGLVVKANIIFGFPNEKFSDRFLNFYFILKMAFIGVHDVPCFGFTPYPGSELFDMLIKEGKIIKDENYYEFMAELVYTKPFNNRSWNQGLSDNTIPMLSLGGMAFFYSCQFIFRPWRFYHLVKNVIQDNSSTMLEIAFANMYNDFWKGRRLKKTNQSL